ncbi:MAG: membrane protein insertion efficiency factor YidD [Candidatus Parcubacteria bacterium]|nr:membrane protein insertion efficiency factor YidD [Candidatus Parcubacteria bacterium]
MAKTIILKIVEFYQKYISFALGKSCRFYPSCSEYTYEAVEKYGSLKGITKGTIRIFKCHPFSKGGVDIP